MRDHLYMTVTPFPVKLNGDGNFQSFYGIVEEIQTSVGYTLDATIEIIRETETCGDGYNEPITTEVLSEEINVLAVRLFDEDGEEIQFSPEVWKYKVKKAIRIE